MKNLILVLLGLSLLSSFSCSSLTECETIEQKELILLLDVSDEKLFTEIEKDLTENFPVFMQNTGLASIKPCQRFTLSFAHLSSQDALEISSEDIAITRKGLSKKEERKEGNPAPLVSFMKRKINDFRLLAKDAVMNKGSNIASVLLKAFIQANAQAESTTIIIFSDMVENNSRLNLYKKIPVENDAQTIEKLIDASILEKYSQLKKEGKDVNLIVVMKLEPKSATNPREIRQFWSQIFKTLDFKNVQFIDNLTNKVEL